MLTQHQSQITFVDRVILTFALCTMESVLERTTWELLGLGAKGSPQASGLASGSHRVSTLEGINSSCSQAKTKSDLVKKNEERFGKGSPWFCEVQQEYRTVNRLGPVSSPEKVSGIFILFSFPPKSLLYAYGCEHTCFQQCHSLSFCLVTSQGAFFSVALQAFKHEVLRDMV